jgi:NADH-quinone oxidoreductase subunit M
VLGAAYTLWMVKRVIFGKVANDGVASLSDATPREALVLGLLAVLVLGMGVWPAPLLETLHASVENLLALASASKL